MYGHDQPHTVESGKVVVGEHTLPVKRTNTTEYTRTTIMVGSLLDKFGDTFEIESSKDSSKFYPFTGGGDT